MSAADQIVALADRSARTGRNRALPLLDAMLPAFSLRGRAAASPGTAFGRLCAERDGDGALVAQGRGSAFELSPILEPLGAFRDQMLVLSGIKSSWNYIHARRVRLVPHRNAARRAKRGGDHR